MSEKQTGVCKFFNDQKGYGFITPDGGGKDVFVHRTALEASQIDTLQEGDKVEFDTEQSSRKPEKGPNAINVRLVEGS